MHAVKSINFKLEYGILVWNLKSFIKKLWDSESYTRFQLGVGPLNEYLSMFQTCFTSWITYPVKPVALYSAKLCHYGKYYNLEWILDWSQIKVD